eukprot:6210051-Pleurochrysis_carterae.AAC.2
MPVSGGEIAYLHACIKLAGSGDTRTSCMAGGGRFTTARTSSRAPLCAFAGFSAWRNRGFELSQPRGNCEVASSRRWCRACRASTRSTFPMAGSLGSTRS